MESVTAVNTGGRLLSESLFNAWNDAMLFRTLATLRLDVPVFDSIQDRRWTGSRADFEEYCDRLGSLCTSGAAGW